MNSDRFPPGADSGTGGAAAAAVAPLPADAPAEPHPKLYRAGSLIYTKAGLFTLFTWLLFGDFSFTLMEAVWHSVLPLELRALEAPNFVISLLMVSIPSAMNFVLNPIISTVSDRYRSRFGRRIPFLLFATPFVAVFLGLLSFARPLGGALHAMLASAGIGSLSANTVIVTMICGLIVVFRFFELFINTVYWYLFNDVVPAHLLGRFLGLFRLVGTLAGALYNFFVYQYAESHAPAIFLSAGVLYGVVFILMCLNVKEGTYPPPDPMTAGSRSPLAYLKTFGKECFHHRVFILIYATGAVWGMATLMQMFSVFLYKSLGLTLDQIGKVTACASLAAGILSYPAGILVDRFHPIRVMLVAKAGLCIFAPVNLIYLFFDFSPSTVFWIMLSVVTVTVPLSAIYAAAGLPLHMRTLPHERFGQFCSANAMTTAVAGIIGSLAAGGFLDLMKGFHPGANFHYRYIPVWTCLFYFCGFAVNWLLFREWKKLGGDEHYRPPCRDKFKDYYKEDPA
jgi:maltose/moltooligosaccharide transporter